MDQSEIGDLSEAIARKRDVKREYKYKLGKVFHRVIWDEASKQFIKEDV